MPRKLNTRDIFALPLNRDAAQQDVWRPPETRRDNFRFIHVVWNESS
jgi:hypothetical protein